MVELRPARRGEVGEVVEWAKALHWNPGVHDLEAAWAQDSSAFWCHVREGEPVGFISATKYEEHLAHVGYYIVKESERGKGLGKELFDFVLATVGVKGRTLMLDGVLAQVENYKKSGFMTRWRNERFRGKTGGTVCLAEHTAVRRLEDVPFKEICDFDRRHFPARRDNFLRSWLSAPGSVGYALVTGDACSEIVGYGVIRKSQSGYRVGPLFATTKEGASQLLHCMLTAVEAEQEVSLDVPLDNQKAVELVTSLGMERVFSSERMFANDEEGKVWSQVALSQVYGLTTLEFG